MLLKTSNGEKTTYIAGNNGKGKRTISSRIHRKTVKVSTTTKPGSGKRVQIGKRISLGKNQKNFNASFPTTTNLCDNSNDSGLGFDHHESQQHNIIQKHQQTNSHIMALTTASNNHHTSSNSSINNGNSVNYQRSINSIRYGDASYATTTSFSRVTNETLAKNKHCTQFGAGKKIKSVIKKPFMPVKNNTNHLTLKNETEDTCGDDFFSTHVQKNNICNNDVSSPTSLTYSTSSSPSEKTSTGSSPILTSSPSPDILNGNNLATVAVATTENTDNNPEQVQNSASLSSFLNQNYSAISRDGSVHLQIVTQPEQQHRARYQTEGSRGAVKDKSGNSFPVVKLNGYTKPAVLQVFIGNDVGRVSPHIFYQACKVSGKNSTPCNEVKVDGTMLIEIEIKPENDMTVICDCVGILKERNVDVEHRLGKNNTLASTVTRNKKKSTKCRMIFRTKINADSDFPEILQICSNTITCTQPPGIPEICKKSLDSCSSIGGKELFIIGKNFLKDTKITFVKFNENSRKKIWDETVLPDKEYLQQTHLICKVPPYPSSELTEPVQVQLYVTSSNKKSEPHTFVYLPLKKYCCSIPQSPVDASPSTNNFSCSSNTSSNNSKNTVIKTQSEVSTATQQTILAMSWNLENENQQQQQQQVVSSPDQMPPPLSTRKPSFSDSATKDIKTINSNDLQETTTSSPIQSSSEMLYSDNNPLMNVTQQCFMNPVASQVPSLLDDFQVHHIKSEQGGSDQQQQVTVTGPQQQQENPQASQASDLNSVQQQQVVENFLNMICAQVEPVIVQQNADNMIGHLNQELIMSTSSDVNATNNSTTLTNVIQANHDGNLMSAIVPAQPMICEQNILSVQLDGPIPLHNPLDAAISSDPSGTTTLISNAVSEAAAETQAVVKQMIASVAAEILSENPNETQSTINNFISTTLGTEIGQVGGESSQQQQTQITTTQQQQLQEIIAQELMTPVMIKKEGNDGQPSNVQDALITDSSVSNNPATQHPFSPTPDFNLTSMSESDLISFINPSVFI